MKIYGDHLTRIQTVKDIIQIIKACVSMKNSATFSVEGDWGRGKTWIIDKVEEALNGIDISAAECVKKDKTKDKEYLVFKYNAWEKDYYDEPLLAILITLVNQLNRELFLDNLLKSELKTLYSETKEVLEKTLRDISKRVIGVDVVDIGKHGFQIFKKVKEKAKIELDANYSENIEKDIATVVAALNKLSVAVPIVFIVDELDRCIPLHSIKTLERLHHIFGKVNSSVTIISINEKQLKNTVELMFGKSISFEAYLRKFVDFRITLDAGKPDVEELRIKLKAYFDLFDLDGDRRLQDEIILNLCDSITAREFEKIYKNAMICHQLVDENCDGFSKDCVMGEILLFAYKLALEKEVSVYNILPTNGNKTTTELGAYLKKFLQQINRNSSFDLSKSKDIILYICAEGLMLNNVMNLPHRRNGDELSQKIENFYKEYIRFYKLVK